MDDMKTEETTVSQQLSDSTESSEEKLDEIDVKIDDLIKKLNLSSDFKSNLLNAEEDLTNVRYALFGICFLMAAGILAFFVYKLVASLREKERLKEEKKKLKMQRKEKEAARKPTIVNKKKI